MAANRALCRGRSVALELRSRVGTSNIRDVNDLSSELIIDVDAHVTEPADLWTSRLPRRFRESAPRVVWRDEDREYRWLVGETLLQSVGAFAMGGWREPYPFCPSNFDDMDPAA